MFLGSPAAAQDKVDEIGWSATSRVDADSAVPTLPSVAASGGVVHLSWFGLDTTAAGTLSRAGLCYVRSTDGGATFSEPIRLLSPFESVPGQLAARDDRVYITAGAFLPTFFGVVLFTSTDAGQTWSAPAPVLGGAFPELLFSHGAELILGYRELETHWFGLVRSLDGGATWQPLARRINELSAMASFGNDLLAIGPTPGASQTEAGLYESADAGRTWVGPEIVSPEDLVRSSYPALAIAGNGSLYAAWTDSGAVILRGSRNGGVSWGSFVPLSTGTGNLAARLASFGPFIAAAWDRDSGGVRGVRLRVSLDGGLTFSTELSPDEGETAREPSIAFLDSTLHLAWVDDDSGGGIALRVAELHATGDGGGTVPSAFSLRQSYPNPTNGRAVIAFDLPVDADIVLRLYNVLGELVATPATGRYARGSHEVSLEVGELASGVYVYRMTGAGFEGIGKMVVLR